MISRRSEGSALSDDHNSETEGDGIPLLVFAHESFTTATGFVFFSYFGCCQEHERFFLIDRIDLIFASVSSPLTSAPVDKLRPSLSCTPLTSNPVGKLDRLQTLWVEGTHLFLTFLAWCLHSIR